MPATLSYLSISCSDIQHRVNRILLATHSAPIHYKLLITASSLNSRQQISKTRRTRRETISSIASVAICLTLKMFLWKASAPFPDVHLITRSRVHSIQSLQMAVCRTDDHSIPSCCIHSSTCKHYIASTALLGRPHKERYGAVLYPNPNPELYPGHHNANINDSEVERKGQEALEFVTMGFGVYTVSSTSRDSMQATLSRPKFCKFASSALGTVH